MNRDVRRQVMLAVIGLLILLASPAAFAQTAHLPSWNDGPARRAIIAFVSAVTSPSNPDFVPEAERIATFDMDGTLWVEQPMYPEVVFAFDHLSARASAGGKGLPEQVHGVLARGRAALDSLSAEDMGAMVDAAMSGMSVEAFDAAYRQWIRESRQPRWKLPYTALAYKPMLELLAYLRSHGFKTYIVTGSGQDFVRSFAEEIYGVPPEQVVGTTHDMSFGTDPDGRAVLNVNSDVALLTVGEGKPEAIQLRIGRRPIAAFGNSGGDAEMLDYVSGRRGRSLAMLVLHDDAEREYAYGPAQGLPDSHVGRFGQALHDRALRDGWQIISIRKDWREVLEGSAP
ncbi:HAD family hydrolase [Aestuariivirga sp.]|uniref:HAD family hydrolase n=1 Tax=Aestuariivirga sp. TaxID=2650926 RepID=UPI003782D460